MDRELRTLVIATGNAGKLREMTALLGPLGLEIRPQSDWAVAEAEETGTTFLENAIIKARNAAAHTGMPALADDSGLVVPALNGEPGIRSARYSESGKDEDNNRRLLDAMSDREGVQRHAYFYCALVLLRSVQDPAPLTVTAAWHGEVLREPHGDGGFGYDPLFLVPERGCASAELPAAEKNQISHRGQAMAKLVALLGEHSPRAEVVVK